MSVLKPKIMASCDSSECSTPHCQEFYWRSQQSTLNTLTLMSAKTNLECLLKLLSANYISSPYARQLLRPIPALAHPFSADRRVCWWRRYPLLDHRLSAFQPV